MNAENAENSTTRTLGVRVTAILFGLVLFWGLAEIGCRLVFANLIAYDVEMWRYTREVKATGLTPGLRFEHRPNTTAHLMGVDVEINDDGLRNRSTPKQKPADTLRVAVVGDSISFGWGVPQDQAYPQQLERLLNEERSLGGQGRFEVVNFGVGNYAASDVAAMLEHKALGYQPDLVIYGAFINDAELAREAGGLSLLEHSLAAVLVWGRLDRLWRQLGLREDYREYYQGLYSEGGAGRERVRQALQAMREQCQQAKRPLIVALLPELHKASGESFAEIRAFYRQTATELGLHFIDLQESLPDNDLRRYWVSADDAHPNAEASERYARAIMNQLPWPEKQ